MIAELIEVVEKVEIVKNTTPSKQVGNYCYLIAGIELMFSCTFFVKLIHSGYYQDPAVGSKKILKAEKKNSYEDIRPLCKILRDYYVTKDSSLYPKIHEIIYSSFLEKYNSSTNREQDDPNILFLYLEKSFIYILLFSRFQYVVGSADGFSNKGPFSIYTFIKNSGLTARETLNKLNLNGIFGVIIYHGAHYEIYAIQKKELVAMNTNFMLDLKWQTMTLILKSYNHNCDLRIKNIINLI